MLGAILGLAALSLAACTAQERLDEARQIVGEALVGEQTQTPGPATEAAPTTPPQNGTSPNPLPTQGEVSGGTPAADMTSTDAPATPPAAPPASSSLTTYYRDTDGDGYGDPATTQDAASPSAGWVLDNSDCADMDASVHPGAVDVPDAASIDANCDGVDGDISRAIFVDSAAGNDSFAGTIAAPVQTIGAGLIAAAEGGNDHVYVAGGVYQEQVTLVNEVSIWGRYSGGETWSRDSVNVTEISYSAADDPLVAISGTGITAATTVADLLIRTGAAPDGVSNYAVHCKGCTGLILERNVIIAGNGGAGVDGSGGVDGRAGADGSSGLNGAADDPFAEASGGIGGRVGCGSGLQEGGAGGPGGQGFESGEIGVNGSGPGGGVGGLGGESITGENALTPGRGLPGDQGVAGLSGVDGSNGLGGLSTGVTDSEFWVGAGGGNGPDGTSGFGGGGGGGGGGQGADLVDDGAGNGGGGGGSGGCGGSGGAGGAAGGGSFGVFLYQSTGVQIVDNVVTSSAGGNGGSGGPGGKGGSGGKGGTGGSAATAEVGAGGQGGPGGDGGDGGHGGGGAGGVSYAVYKAGTTVDLSSNRLASGSAGPGGVSLGNPGTDGDAGASN